MKRIFMVVFACLAVKASAQPEFRTDPISIVASANYEDAKAIGMGRTQFANGAQFNAMLYNPALLAHERFALDVPSFQAGMPGKSIRALRFLVDNVPQFRQNGFIGQIHGGLTDFRNAGTDDERLAALRRVQGGLRFLNELQQKVGGPADNPTPQGVGLASGFGGQFGSWGLAFYGSAQTSFALFSSDVVGALATVPIPQTAAELDDATLAQLLAATGALFDANGNIRPDAIPLVVGVSHADLVAAGGFAQPVGEHLSLGTNLKVVYRHFLARAIDPDNFGRIINDLREERYSSAVGVTLDLGGLYRFANGTTQVGMSVQNVLPVKVVTSDMQLTNYAFDQNGAIVPVRVTIPFELRLPLLVNAGLTQAITPDWDVSLDVADIASQDTKYDDGLSRIRVGSEYRLSTGRNGFGVAFRAGLAEKNPTFGVGLNFGNVVQLDGAYAYDNFVDDNAWFARAKFGW